MSHFAPLLAANDAELVRVIVIIVFGLLVGIGKFMAMVKKTKPPAPMGQRPAPPPPVNMNAKNEIEEFMRRAAAKPRPASNAGPVRQPPQPRPRPTVEKPLQAQVVSEEPVGARIGKEVDRDLDTQEFSKRSTQLGSEVAQADREIDQRLHQLFDHHVSNLELMPGEAAISSRHSRHLRHRLERSIGRSRFRPPSDRAQRDSASAGRAVVSDVAQS